MLRSHLGYVGIGWFVIACGGTTPAAQEPGATSDAVEQRADAAGALGEGEVAWKDMNREQRLEYMGVTVMPAMKALFQEYDPEGYAEFKCQTCHGEDMEQADFEMPNGLYALPAADPITAAKEYDAEVTAFMLEKLTPKMAELLGMQPGEEMTCMSCHEAE